MKVKRAFHFIFLRLSTIPLLTQRVRRWFVKLGGVKIVGSGHIGVNVNFDTLAPQNITIGNGVCLTMNTVVLTHYYIPKGTDEKKMWRYGYVNIEDYAFIGANSVIANSVRIGKYSVVAANSVVTKDIPDYEVWGGVPAHFIKKREMN